MKLLITGFPPYGQFKTNSSLILIESIQKDTPETVACRGDELVFEMIDLDSTTISAQKKSVLRNLLHLLKAHRPDACLFLGQSTDRPHLSLEKMAINYCMNGLIDPQGPVAYWTTLPDIEGLAGRLKELKIPARLSFSAGIHLCNFILYQALHYTRIHSLPISCGFMHVPLTQRQTVETAPDKPIMPLEMTRKALLEVVMHLSRSFSTHSAQPDSYQSCR